MYQKPYEDRDFLHQKYIVERLSIAEISSLIFSAPSTVHKYLRKFDIPLRAADEKNRNRLAYGEAWRAKWIAAHKREQETVAKIRDLRLQGFSYGKIADVLNAMKVPTKRRRGRWLLGRFNRSLIEWSKRRIQRIDHFYNGFYCLAEQN